MAKTEQIVTDRKTMKELVEFMEEAVREGLTKDEINSQVDLLLDQAARVRLEKSLKEIRKGKVKRFRDPRALLKALHSL
jgi:regulatory protein YycI of two-component signal transduction system YycFG